MKMRNTWANGKYRKSEQNDECCHIVQVSNQWSSVSNWSSLHTTVLYAIFKYSSYHSDTLIA